MYGVGLGIGVWAGSRDQCRDGCMGWGVGISVWAMGGVGMGVWDGV